MKTLQHQPKLGFCANALASKKMKLNVVLYKRSQKNIFDLIHSMFAVTFPFKIPDFLDSLKTSVNI